MKKEVEIFLKRKNISIIIKLLKSFRRILIILDITVVLNIIYFAIVTPSSFEFTNIVPNYIKIYNYSIGIFNIVYLGIVLIIAVILGIINRINLKKINKK